MEEEYLNLRVLGVSLVKILTQQIVLLIMFEVDGSRGSSGSMLHAFTKNVPKRC